MKKSNSILIVDDEENVFTSLKRALRNEPYEILTAQSASEGLEILKDQEIDLVISDFLMPEMSGIEFFRQIRVLYPYTLRVMLTGKAGYKEAIQAINEKLVYRFLTKPWGNEELKLTLRLALEHKQAEEALKIAHEELHQKNEELTESFAKLQELQDFNENIINNMMSGLIVMDLTRKVLKINDAALKTLYIGTEKDIIGQPITDISPSLDAFCQITQSTAQQEVEFVIPEKRVKPLAFFSSYLYGSDGDQQGIITLFQDLTKLKKAEMALRDSEKRYRLLAENVTDIILTMDLDLNITYISPSITHMTGYSMEEAGKISLDQHIKPESFKIISKTIEEELDNENDPEIDPDRTWTLELEQYRKDGSTFWQETALKFLRDQNGKPIGVLGVIRNISERKEMEEERLKSSKLGSIGILAGGIAHDFSNLLTAILGNISLTKLQLESGSEGYQMMEQAETACKQATRLTQQLLTYSKGGAPIKKSTSISEIVEDSANFSLRGTNVRCEFSFQEDLWAVEVDPGQISQVIHNLVINAIQAMPDGGSIHINAENISLGNQKVLSLKKGKYVKLTVKDEGVGIPKDSLNMLFDPYYSTKKTGSGLGLATSYSIIKNHDGLITVESELGTGTTFFIYLPASQKEVSNEKVEEKKIPTGNGKILIMDDEELVRNVAGAIVRKLGYEVEFAEDGTKAIDAYTKAKDSDKPFDALIIDLTVPGGMGGKEAIQKLIKIDPEVKAIVSSGYSDDPIMSDYKNYGFSGVIVKPYKIEELGDALHDLLL